MKLSVSLSGEDVEFLDQYARTVGAQSRSAVIQRAVQLLRASELDPAYAEAWKEWETSGDSEIWEAVTGDGFEPSRRSDGSR
jgi:Arc/MetJ-type ribon-helix-helix transcriptional regulator